MKAIFCAIIAMFTLNLFVNAKSNEVSTQSFPDNIYIVDTISIKNARVISLGYPGSYSIFSFVTNSATANIIASDLSKIKTKKMYERYLRDGNSLINSSNVYLTSTDYLFMSIAINSEKTDNITYDLTNCSPIEEVGETICTIEDVPIEIRRFPSKNDDAFILSLFNVRYINNICMDCSKMNYTVPAIIQNKKYVEVVFPMSSGNNGN